MDMDGVLVREEHPIAGAAEFITRLRELGRPFLVLTNNSIYTRRDLAARLAANGLEVPEEAIWTSALATADFLESQRPGGSAFAIGEAGLTTALHSAGYTLTERDPDYVVLGETRTYSFERIAQAIRLIVGGARFIATNPDPTGPTPDGPLPATGAVAALISRATGVEPYFVGKPNPLMMRSALNAIDAHSETSAMVGDRMETDIVSGLEAGMHTVLVLTGSTTAGRGRAIPLPPVADRRLDRRSGRRARLRGLRRPRPGRRRRPRRPRRRGLCGDARRGVRIVLVERLVLEQRCGEPVELRAVLGEQFDDFLVGVVDDPAHLLVDQLLCARRDLGRAGEQRALAVRRKHGDRPDRLAHPPAADHLAGETRSAAGCPTRRLCVGSP